MKLRRFLKNYKKKYFTLTETLTLTQSPSEYDNSGFRNDSNVYTKYLIRQDIVGNDRILLRTLRVRGLYANYRNSRNVLFVSISKQVSRSRVSYFSI